MFVQLIEPSPHHPKRMRLASHLTTSSSLSTEQQECETTRNPPTLHSSSNGGGGGGGAPDIREVLIYIEGVSDWRSLGTHLGIKSSKLDEISRYLPEEHKPQLVAAWLQSDGDCTLDKLAEALEKPSVREVQAAENVRARKPSLISSTLFMGSSVEADGPQPSRKLKELFKVSVCV